MNAVLADAGYWIALFNPRDQLHTKARAISNSLQGRTIITSQMVLTEFLCSAPMSLQALGAAHHER